MMVIYLIEVPAIAMLATFVTLKDINETIKTKNPHEDFYDSYTRIAIRNKDYNQFFIIRWKSVCTIAFWIIVIISSL